MGILKRAGRTLGYVDRGLIEHGLLARGTVVECRRTAMSTGNQVQRVVCELTVEVELEDRPIYTATCKHPISVAYLSQFESGQGSVAVRVDPDDPQNIELDLEHDVPPPRGGAAPAAGAAGGGAVRVVDASQGGLPPEIAQQLAAQGIDLSGAAAAAPAAPPQNRTSPLTAAEILATGTPCRAIVQTAQPLGFQKDGRDVWGLVLNAIADGEEPSAARVGVGVAPEHAGLLFPGANLPAKRRLDVPDCVSIDFQAAAAER